MSTKNKLVGAAAAAALLVAGGGDADAATKDIPATARARVFLAITKIDSKSRTIEARITDETVDSSGEICDYETSAPLFAKWSENAEKLTAGKSKGNVRAMHGPKAAGKLTEISFDDAQKAIDCIVKVVDDAEWEKVEEGVYTGLSLGGNYVGKKWKDSDTGAWRYTVDPVEVSLVDLPCNSSATFKAVGLDGVEVEKAFKPWEPDKRDIEARAMELHKAAAAEGTTPIDYLDEARADLISKRLEPEGEGGAPETPAAEEPAAEGAEKVAGAEGADAVDWEVDQVFRCRADGSVHTKKADAKAHIEKLQAVEQVGGADLLAQAIAKAKAAVAGEPAATPEAETAPRVVKVEGLEEAVACLKVIAPLVEANPVAVVKGLWDASRALDVLSSVCSLASCAAWEAEWEGDNSKVPGMLADAARALGEAALAYAQEEIAEAMAALPELSIDNAVEGMDAVVVELARTGLTAVKADTALVQKVGARNSAADTKRIQAIHDAAKELGGACEAEKVEAPEVQKLVAENTALKGQIEGALPAINDLTESVTKLRGELDTAKTRLAEIEKGPAPMPTPAPGTQVVSRGATPDAAPLSADQAEVLVKALMTQLGQEGFARMAMKAAQAGPGIPVSGTV